MVPNFVDQAKKLFWSQSNLVNTDKKCTYYGGGCWVIHVVGMMLLQRCHSWSKSKLTQELPKTHFYCSINRHLKDTIACCPRCDEIRFFFRRTSSRRSVSCRGKEIRTLYYLLPCIKFDLKPKPVHFVKFETINGLDVTNRLRLYPSIWILLGSILHSLFSSRLSHYRVHKVMLNNTCINNDTVFFLHALVSLPVAMFFFFIFTASAKKEDAWYVSLALQIWCK